jgi:diaminohydroxyphosphoribosylaminopyrimidine deaminase / 5-amino-6-(5-phosphoribosylamino)uracil reductase
MFRDMATQGEAPAWAHERFMRIAIDEAEKARNATGDNPWVGCAIVSASGALVAVGHTLGPGEDHAEIVAMQRARELGADLSDTVLYSTLEPCSFHGRTPACSRAVVNAGVHRVATGIRDPNPRVDGVGVQILREAGLEVVEDVCAREITLQLAPWIFRQHPHEPLRRARAWASERGCTKEQLIERLCEHYGVAREAAAAVIAQLPR